MSNYACYTLGRSGSTYSLRALSKQNNLWNFEEVFKESNYIPLEEKYKSNENVFNKLFNCTSPYAFKFTAKQYPFINHQKLYKLIEQNFTTIALYRNDIEDWLLSYILAYETKQWHSDECMQDTTPCYSNKHKAILEILKKQAVQFKTIHTNFQHLVEYENIDEYFYENFNTDINLYTGHTKLYTKLQKVSTLGNIDQFFKDVSHVFEEKKYLF